MLPLKHRHGFNDTYTAIKDAPSVAGNYVEELVVYLWCVAVCTIGCLADHPAAKNRMSVDVITDDVHVILV